MWALTWGHRERVLWSARGEVMATRKKRVGLSVKVRFEVFKRDKFTCQYCGAKAPDVLLNADHIKPVASGGSSDLVNLVTSCVSCNSGKGARELSDDSAVKRSQTQAEELQERREQLDMLMQWHEGLTSIDDAAVDGICDAYKRVAVGWSLNPSGKSMVRAMVQQSSVTDVLEALRNNAHMLRFNEDGKATEDSVNALVGRWKTSIRYLKQNREDPVGSQLLYIRGIVRRRFEYYRSEEAYVLSLLQWATNAAHVEPSVLKGIAVSAVSFREWEQNTKRLLGELVDEFDSIWCSK